MYVHHDIKRVRKIVFKDMLFPKTSGCFLVSKSEFRATKCIIITKLFKKVLNVFALLPKYTKRFLRKKHTIYKSMFKAQASKKRVLSFIIYQVYLGVAYTVVSSAIV